MLYRKVFSMVVLLLLVLGLFLFSEQSTPTDIKEIAIDVHSIAKQMFPDSEIEFISENRFKVSTDEEHSMEYKIDRIYFNKFIDEEEFLVVLKIPEDKTSHAGGFYNITLAVFDLNSRLKSTVKNFAADDGELALFKGSSKTYVMYVGNTTYQGYTEYTGGLYDISKSEWTKVFPKNESFWEHRKAVIGNNELVLFKRVIDRKGNETIPNSYFIFEKELFWDSNKARLISRIESTPSYGVEGGVLLKPKIKIYLLKPFMNREV